MKQIMAYGLFILVAEDDSFEPGPTAELPEGMEHFTGSKAGEFYADETMKAGMKVL